MDELLTPVSTLRTSKKEPEADLFRQVSVQEHQRKPETKSTASTPTSLEDALEILKHEPGYDSLISTLRFLSKHQAQGSRGNAIPSIKQPSPQSAQLVQVLVSEIVPNYWALLKEDGQGSKKSGLSLLVACLQSITGINGILIRLRALTQEFKSETSDKVKRPDVSLNLGILLDLLSNVLRGDSWMMGAWKAATSGQDDPGRTRPRVQEIITTLGGGRIISVAAEAHEIVKSNNADKSNGDSTWPADALQYTNWLGRNIVAWYSSGLESDSPKFGSDLFSKASKLGHADSLIKLMLAEMVLKENAEPSKLGLLLSYLPQTEQCKVLFAILKQLSADYLDHLGRCETEESKPKVSAVAGALGSIIAGNESGRSLLVDWLTGSSGAGLGEGVGIRRAVMAVVSQQKDDMIAVLEKSLGQFGDQLYIKHSPILQQEAHAQVLLLSAGYVFRQTPIKLNLLMRSSVWLNAVSNRLSAPHERSRFLGLVVGEGLSGLVDKGDKKLDFKMDETDEEEGRWYKGLTQVSDEVGTLEPLFKPHSTAPKKPAAVRPPPASRRPPTQPQQTGFIIEELSDEEAPEEDDIVPYAKPDSDEEDSDDDPTLIRRDKPKAPVYIRELIRYLRDADNYDHQKLALATAPTLIRRKAEYGTEVKEHADELASLLVGLGDKFEIEEFDELRVQGMIALVVAQPKIMAPWFAKTFFDGDYSISQRASVLIVLGLSARELAGFDTSNYAAAAAFPSKALPGRVEKLYLNPSTASIKSASSALKPLPPNALDDIARSITDDFLMPMAATAADAATGPNALKLSTFTERLNDPTKVKHKTRTKPRVRTILNTTAGLISTSFFSPLIARFQAALHSSSSTRSRKLIVNPYLLSLYLKTLAIFIHASGPSTLSLPQMTAELWRLLLHTSVRAQAVGDLTLTRAILFAFMALLDVNEDRMRDVCAEMGREVAEAQNWVAGVFAGLRGGDEGGEEEQVKMLAAGVLVRLQEGIEKYQLVMVGDLIGF
ncbi:telomere length regulation protein-domain-containing protein [Podospora australis]|uniref:Telomere length regulation protein-domain-containing protein n=1 Tax=Podospora australis TaxID=1536484 RepID=A0AAN7AM31_9PEZI|nr:telomere length regulation protein-domain-containing protein [Podospora australis]